MPSSFVMFKKQIDEAVSLIENSRIIESDDVNVSLSLEGLIDTHSLLNRCEDICENYEIEKPAIRIIHHFACSGGSLISKCLSAMPNIFILSEVHPYSGFQLDKSKIMFSPSDITRLSFYADIPEHKKLAKKIFIDSIKTVNSHVIMKGGVLIIRDHSHSDYCVGEHVYSNTIIELLKENFTILSQVTVRNPIDSYLSLVTNGWVHFQPKTFDEYCIRLLNFLSNFSNEEILWYEDLVQQPHAVVEKICNNLKIQFDDSFDEIFNIFSVTGDSGRKGGFIGPRKRRDIPGALAKEIAESEHYKKICHLYSVRPLVDL